MDGNIEIHLTWYPIDSAPRDRVILTDCGFSIYVDQRHWGSPVTNGWYLCDPRGDILSCADDGMRISLISPKIWTHAPVIPVP